jgi:hypothetical protein
MEKRELSYIVDRNVIGLIANMENYMKFAQN